MVNNNKGFCLKFTRILLFEDLLLPVLSSYRWPSGSLRHLKKSLQNDLQFGDLKIFDIRVVFYLNSASFQQYEGQIVLNHEVQYILKICLTV